MDPCQCVVSKTLFFQHTPHYPFPFYNSLPECCFSFRFFFFQKSFPCFLSPQSLADLTLTAPTPTTFQMASLARFPKHPTLHKRFVRFVLPFSFPPTNQTLNLKKKNAELFLFEFFDSPSRKLIKRVKVSRIILFHDNRETKKKQWKKTKQKQCEEARSIRKLHIPRSTHIRVLSKIMQRNGLFKNHTHSNRNPKSSFKQLTKRAVYCSHFIYKDIQQKKVAMNRQNVKT